MLFGILMHFGLGGGVATSKTLAGFGVSLHALKPMLGRVRDGVAHIFMGLGLHC
jgi:hypothetical protein